MWYVMELAKTPEDHLYRVIKFTYDELKTVNRICDAYRPHLGMQCKTDYHEGEWRYIPLGFKYKRDAAKFVKFLMKPEEKVFDYYGTWIAKDRPEIDVERI